MGGGGIKLTYLKIMQLISMCDKKGEVKLTAISLVLSTWTQIALGYAFMKHVTVTVLVLLRSSSPLSQKVSVELSVLQKTREVQVKNINEYIDVKNIYEFMVKVVIKSTENIYFLF